MANAECEPERSRGDIVGRAQTHFERWPEAIAHAGRNQIDRPRQFRQIKVYVVLLPCQIVRTARRVIYRILGYNPWLKDFFATWERVRQMAPTQASG